jgi:hypothetical protein
MTFRAACLLVAAASSLSGCVAAALPALAAGSVIRTQADKPATEAERGPPRVAIDLTPPAGVEPPAGTAAGAQVQSYTLADGTRMEVMTGQSTSRDAVPEVPPTAASETSLAATDPPPLAVPVGAAAAATAVPPGGTGAAFEGFTSYDPFYGYALAQGNQPAVGSERRSALLVDPGTLSPKTRACSIHPPAVLIDLDPSTGMLDPAAATRADPRLVATLAALRAQEITVGWISSVTADRAGAVRRALVASGLDIAGRDELVLLRFPEERKQTRREDFAKEFCVVAIAGDERGDFDELFLYLKDPERAAPLNALVGKGWFLIPHPLS